MSTDTTDTTDSNGEPGDSNGASGGSPGPARRGGTWATADLRERLQWVALVVLAAVAVATLFAFYTNVSNLITLWASRRFEPALQAAFSLAVLAAALAGIARLARRLD